MADSVRIHAGRQPHLWAASQELNPELLQHCHLFLDACESSLSFAVFDPRKAQFEAAGKFNFSPGAFWNEIDGLVAETSLLRQEYHSMVGTWFSPWNTLVPLPLFDPDKNREYLEFNLKLPESAAVYHDQLQNLDACLVYALPNDKKGHLKRLFPKMSLRHHSSASIDIRLLLHKHIDTPQVFLHFIDQHFELLVTHGRQLRFYNTFAWNSPEDVAYYLLFVAEQMQLATHELQPVFSGEIPVDGPIAALLQPYVQKIQWATRPKGYQFSAAFDELPEHFFFHPLHLLLCA
ncbi:MAG: DUF3822 family protein [Salibacteraceae bacterium]